MNGELVGEWTTLRTGTPVFRYTATWSQSPRARALSLSMPITDGGPTSEEILEILESSKSEIPTEHTSCSLSWPFGCWQQPTDMRRISPFSITLGAGSA